MRLSYSSIDMFKQCKRWYYLNYIEKLRVYQDTKYMDRGKVVHELLEDHYKHHVNIISLKSKFEKEWLNKKLYQKMPYDKERTWIMVQRGIDYNLNPTHCEFKFYYEQPHYLGYADVVDTNLNLIGDYKTSTYQNKQQYMDQMKYYSWAYFKHFGVIPLAKVYFLKYENKENRFQFTLKDVESVEEEIITINKFIETNLDDINTFERCSTDPRDCPYFCPYKDQCFKTDDKFKFCARIVIQGTKCRLDCIKDPLLLKGIDKSLTYELPGRIQIQKAILKKHGNIPNIEEMGIVHLFNRRNMMFDIGFVDRIKTLLHKFCQYKKYDLVLNVEDKRNKDILNQKLNIMPDKLCNIELRDYQDLSVEKFMNRKIGVLNISVGGGKTEIAAEVIRRLDGITLWLTHKKELLHQTKDRLKDRLGMDIGIIQGKNETILPVTVATIQTIHRNLNKYIGLLSKVKLIVVDECHHGSAKTWKKVLQCCPAFYRLGLSGSIPNDYRMIEIESHLGPIIHKITEKTLIGESHLANPKVIMYQINNRLVMGTWPEVEDEFIVNNKFRNELIKKICDDSDGFVVIAVKRILHGKNLNKMIDRSVFINGQLDDKTREQIMSDARKNKIKVLIGTVINEGIDLPNIDTVIYSPGGGVIPIDVIQFAGRVLRKNENREKLIIDFYDKGKYLTHHSSCRKQVYEQYSDVEIINKDIDEQTKL